LSSRFEHAVLGNDVVVQLAHYVSLDTSYRLELGMPLRYLAGRLSASPVVYLQPSDSDDVYRAVRCPASAPVEPVECREPRRRRTRCHPAQQNDDSLLEPLRIVPPHSDHQLDSALRADTLLLEDGPDGCIELVHLIVEVLVATGERLEGDATGERGATLAGRARP
jgi:hypothetical protein